MQTYFQIIILYVLLQEFRAETILDGVTQSVSANTVERIDGILTIIRSAQANGDGRRTYQCIKFLVHVAEKCKILKDTLNKRLDRWQWAVDWLKNEMDAMGGNATAGTSGLKTSGSETTSFTNFGISTPQQHVSTSVTISTTTTSLTTTVSTGSQVSPGTSSTTSSVGVANKIESLKLPVPDGKSNEDSTTKNFQRTVSAQYTLDQANALFGDLGGRKQMEDDEEGNQPETSGNSGKMTEKDAEKAQGTSPGKKAGNSMFYIE